MELKKKGKENIITSIFGKHELAFQRIYTKNFKSLLIGEITSLNEVGNSIYILSLIFDSKSVDLISSILPSIQPENQSKINK